MKKHYLPILAATCSLLLPFSAAAGEWIEQNNQWYYNQDGVYLNNGWNEIDGKWYYFKSGSRDMRRVKRLPRESFPII